MDELDYDFWDEVVNMRLEIAHKKKMKNRTQEEAKHEVERDDMIDKIYDSLEEECTDAGKALLRKYSDELAYRESEDADFYYESGFLDGVALVMLLQKIGKEYC